LQMEFVKSSRCAKCGTRFEPSPYLNRFQRAAGQDARRVPARYCSNACKQAAYRKRIGGRPQTPLETRSVMRDN